MMNLKFTGLQRITEEADFQKLKQGRRDASGVSLPSLLKGLVWLCVAVWIFAVWPFGGIRQEFVSKSFADDDMRTDVIKEDMPVVVEFIPQYDRLESIGIVLNRNGGEVSEGTMSFQVYDPSVQLIAQKDVAMTEIEDGGYTDIPLSLSLEPGMTYFFRIEARDLGKAAPTLSYRSMFGCGPEENRVLHYGGTVIEDGSPVSRYEYGKPLGILQILCYDSLGILIGFVLTAWIERVSQHKDEA